MKKQKRIASQAKLFFETSNDKRDTSLKITKNWVISAVSRPKNIKTYSLWHSEDDALAAM